MHIESCEVETQTQGHPIAHERHQYVVLAGHLSTESNRRWQTAGDEQYAALLTAADLAGDIMAISFE